MAEIRGFRGVRYDLDKVGDLDAVVAPPYDVISPQDEEWLCNRHPNNIVRLILPRGDGDKYARAAETLGEWLRDGTLVQDPEPAIYACEQEFEVSGERKKRLGFTCLLRLEDYERRTVLPHENTLDRPREDRLNLIRATGANFDSVFGLYSDSPSPQPSPSRGEGESRNQPSPSRGEGVEAALRKNMERPPDAEATDRDGVRSSLWRIPDLQVIDAMACALADESVLIADGHHRYAAALGYRDEMRAQHGTADPDAPWEFVMMTLVSFEDEGLVVLPTHRLVRNIEGFDADLFLIRLWSLFETHEWPGETLMEAVESLDSEGHFFGLHLGGARSYIMKLRSEIAPEEAIESPGSDALKRLDVSILHSHVLDKLLGIGTANLSAQANLSYTRDAGEALEAVERGEFQLAFLMKAPKVEEVRTVAAAGDRMPQKSTFFYPKLLTGLVMRVIGNG